EPLHGCGPGRSGVNIDTDLQPQELNQPGAPRMATFEVIEKQALKMIRATIENETIRAEAGAMHYMIGNVTIESKAPTAGGFLKSMVTNESVFKPTYTG